MQFCDWLETAEWFDSRGPKKTGEWLGVPRRAISQLNSPIDMTLLRRFAQATRLEPTDPLYAFMKMVGDDLLEYLRVARERLDFIDAARRSAGRSRAATDVIEALFLPRTEPAADEPSSMLGSYIRAQKLDGVIAAIVYPDRRGEGFGIGRYEDHPGLDFSRVESQPDVHFAHKSGFMCKTSASDPASSQGARGARLASAGDHRRPRRLRTSAALRATRGPHPRIARPARRPRRPRWPGPRGVRGRPGSSSS